MKFGFGDDKASGDSRSPSVDPERPNRNRDVLYAEGVEVQCPPHTTERKLVTKIDFHVLPFLCIMYLLAFLGKPQQASPNLHSPC